MIIAGQFMIGLGAGACYFIGIVIMYDLFSDNMRQTGILAAGIAWGIGQMAYFLIDKLMSGR
jgi:hypothetical protein